MIAPFSQQVHWRAGFPPRSLYDMRYFFRPLFLFLACLTFAGCASAQTAIERRFIPDAGLEFPAFAQSDDRSSTRVENTAWNEFLMRYVAPNADGVNRVRYGDVTPDDRILLGGYIAALEAADPASLSSDEQLSYWINLYNAVTIAVVLDHYPLSSIRKIKSGPFDFDGPWDDKRVTIAGAALSLNDIEHGIIRAVFNEPRIHYAINCASIGCPNLRSEAYEGTTLNHTLSEQARTYINHPRGVSIDERGRVTASKIYAWFREDFGENESDVLGHIRQYAMPELIGALDGATKIQRYNYDWSLNGAGPE